MEPCSRSNMTIERGKPSTKKVQIRKSVRATESFDAAILLYTRDQGGVHIQQVFLCRGAWDSRKAPRPCSLVSPGRTMVRISSNKLRARSTQLPPCAATEPAA
jgi:hypothetical protein